MDLDPGLLHYCCIAKETTVLAEFNSSDAELGPIAVKCLEKTPPFHATFSHTVRSRTYSFLINQPFVYFAIFDEKLEKSEGFAFLESVRGAFVKDFDGAKKLDKLSSHCFQGEFNPIFRQLIGPALYHMDDEIDSPIGQRIGENGSFQYGSGPIRGRSRLSGDRGSNKMKNAVVEEFKICGRNGEKEFDDNSSNAIGLSPEFSPITHKNRGLFSGEMSCHQKAKKVWKKQVWVILSLDLIACAILFVVWLWVCSGLKCLES